MFNSRGGNGYGQQQPQSSQSPYTPQNSSASTLMGGAHQEAELGGYKAQGYVPGHSTAAAAAGAALPSQSYAGQYGGLVYSSGGQQTTLVGTKGTAATTLDGKSNFRSSMTESPRVPEYPTVERRQYTDHGSVYSGRELPREATNRFAASTGFGHEKQSKLFDLLEQATLLSQEEMLKARTQQSASVEGGVRQIDYLATRAAARLPIQDPIAHDGRVNLEPHNLSLLSNSSYVEQHASSILGTAPPINVEDLVYARSYTNTGHGVGLPSGRDYRGGKGLLGPPLELDYPTGMLGRTSHPRLDDPINDRATYMRELEHRDRDRDYLREQEKDREREKDWLRECEREREREQEREREREREREKERARQRERQRDDPINDRATYMRELEQRDRDRDYLREQEKDREREKDWLRECEREREREREQEREREREREREKERARQRERQRDDPINVRATYMRELEQRDRDRDWLRERECEREQERERERERERKTERARQRELERERHERERKRERREKDRDREHKRALELKQRTPPGVSREHRGSSLSKDIKSLPQESTHHEISHRVHSPVTGKRREYMCKVFSFSFVEAERDYLSLAKRYPRLYISPDCSKVAVYWPKKNLHLSLYTPVSLEHDFIEESTGERKGKLSAHPSTDTSKSGGQTTIWNPKIILMSGLSEKYLAELSSERLYDDRILHFCNMLKFSVFKQNNSLRAIGGPWDAVDGGNPSVDDSALIRTALRYAKDLINLDLKNCQHWNRFLEIHYERVGQDGLFSHKEVTVLYVPDLSDCLPSLEAWREQWLTHKKHVSEREHLNYLKKQGTGDGNGGLKDKKELGLLKDSKGKPEHLKKKEPPSSSQSGDASGKGDNADKLKAEESEHPKKKEPPSSSQSGGASGKRNIADKLKAEEPELRKKKEPPSSRRSGGVSGKGDVADMVKAEEPELDKEKNKVSENGKGDVADMVKAEEPELDKEKNKVSENNDRVGSTDEEKKLGNKVEEEHSNALGAVGTKPGKKKIVKRIVKKKVAKIKEGSENATEQNNEQEKEDAGGQNVSADIGGQQDGASGNPAKIVKESGGSAVRKADSSSLAGNTARNPQSAEKSADVKPEDHSAEALEGTKSTIKEKVVKKVPKRKVASADIDTKVAENDTKTEEMKMCSDGIKEEQNKAAAENQVGEAISKETNSLETDPLKTAEKRANKKDLSGSGMPTDGMNKKVSESEYSAEPNEKTKVKEEKDHEQKDRKVLSRSGMTTDGMKQKVSENVKSAKSNEKVKLEKEGKDLVGSDSRSQTNKTEKEKKRKEEPPRHPGLILQTRGSKDAKLQSLSFSLDSLLDYSDKDIEESTFELSIFAESMYEMLQYEMGSRILSFLEKLRGKFIAKRNHQKRERKETSEKENKESSSRKRVKTDKTVDATQTKTDNTDNTLTIDANVVKEKTMTTELIDEPKIEDKVVEEEPEDDEEEGFDTELKAGDAVDNDDAQADHNEQQETAKQISEVTTNLDPSNKDQSTKKQLKTTVTQDSSVDKELLQAFRFFDRNRVGYIRVVDLRVIIHNLGKFLTHRNVKELVQSALLETNTARDDRILYEKLARMTDV